MDFICIPLVFGCPTKISQTDDGTNARVVSVISAKSRTWFEFCFVPLIPMSSHHIWFCGICSWEARQGQGFEPMLPGQGPPPGPWQQGWYPGPQSPPRAHAPPKNS
ncbi:uncharacterized protein EI90DRAFT_855327 [Cantharellus anzutake]|uniref:uncharacterized protein n=1 Tax=Cantharellus anzutake TaxID=1750568 RepID=UPI0019083378|nr:uncharacterized protein EI90DRAFT_855327 [Cantharellus anzutake]KAF8332398.1 hypothetical protein EI90DRAFT_855327 [Cantharellus anzutake]